LRVGERRTVVGGFEQHGETGASRWACSFSRHHLLKDRQRDFSQASIALLLVMFSGSLGGGAWETAYAPDAVAPL